MTSGPGTETHHRAVILEPQQLADLRRDPTIAVVDTSAGQTAALRRLLPPPDPELTAEPPRWVYYPWRRTVVRVLGPRAFRRLRLDRNRNLITLGEQDRLASLTVGVVGLSVGHAIAYGLAAQGLCGHLRLTDFDDLELSNLNRVPATVFDLGVNKSIVAARRIAELDPYLTVEVLEGGLTPDTVDEFLAGLDVVVDECDSLDVKALVREAARARRRPVLMATSDRGLVDVERFDLEPDRPIFHGLLGGVDVAQLSGLTGTEKIPHVLRILDATSLSARGAASLVEVGHTLSTWPQLAGDVGLGATAVAEAVRRIGLGEPLASGRVRIDVTAALDALTDPAAHRPGAVPEPDPDPGVADAPDLTAAVVAAAVRAPSGGNVQPWHIEADSTTVTIDVAPQHSSAMDVSYRASAVAVGAAAFNARVAAAAHGALGTVEFAEPGDACPLRAVVRLGGPPDAALAGLYPLVLQRHTNRHRGTPSTLDPATVDAMRAAARSQGARVEVLTSPADIGRAATILGAADRIRYLTPRLHADMTAELRRPGVDDLEAGLDVRSLELDDGQLQTLEILRRPDVMAALADWDAGAALAADTRARVQSSSALAVVSTPGARLTDYARGGEACEAVWLAAQGAGLAVQPISPVFLYARTEQELVELAPTFAESLGQLQSEFRTLTRNDPAQSQVLVLRLSHAPPPSVTSRRRPVQIGQSRLR